MLVVLILEAGIRCYDLLNGLSTDTHNNLELMYIPSAYFNYGFRPNMKVMFNRKHRERMSINSLGLRGEEFSVEKGNKYRIICLGGSSTMGNGISDDAHTWPAQLQKLLREKYPKREIEVINAGGFAYASYELLAKYLFQLSNYSPDMVIFYETFNDACFMGWLSPGMNIDKLRGNMHRNPIHRFLCWSALGSFLSSRVLFPSHFVETRNRNFDRRYIDFGLRCFERNLETLILRAFLDNVKVVLCTQALWLERANSDAIHLGKEDKKAFIDIILRCRDLIKRLSVRYRTILVENDSLFEGEWNKFMINIVHPNDAGAELLAKNIFIQIEPQIDFKDK